LELKSNLIQLVSFDKFSDIKISASVFLQSELVTIQFIFEDAQEKTLLDKFKSNAEVIKNKNHFRSRKMKLWENTCFELFLGSSNENQYLEFNLSAGGDWNVFSFDDYRKNLIELFEVEQLSFDLKCSSPDYEITGVFRVRSLNLNHKKYLANLTAVLQTTEGVKYYSRVHPQQKADFHDKNFWYSL